MTSVAGASRFTATAALAIKKNEGLAQPPNILSDAGTNILDAARQDTGIGLSGRSRSLTKSFLNDTKSGFNSVFSLSAAKMGSNEIIQREILAIRAGLSDRQLAPSLRGETVDETV